MADPPPDSGRSLTGSIIDFTAELRARYGFGSGHAATRDALRAAGVVGVTDARRLRSALRAVYCATPDEVAQFDAAFEAFFRAPHGVEQPDLRSRNTRPDRNPPAPEAEAVQRTGARKARDETTDEAEVDAAQRRVAESALSDAAQEWQAMRARYSSGVGRTAPPRIDPRGIDAHLAAATRLIASLRIARSRRRRVARDGDRIALRRTLRASVATAGDPVVLHWTAPVRRSARFLILIDGSRSMADYAAPMLQFAYALCRRSRRANAFVFSTGLHEITAALTAPGPPGRTLPELGDAWGGGTRIGESLAELVRVHGPRLLSPETLVFVFSDGLDVGDLHRLDRALRELSRRSAGIVWLNPHAGSPTFAPSAGGMRVALPYLTALHPARDERDFAELARTLSRAV
ncbi:MAG TPA: VWA domain-containing protein [Candidatus Elarobacter sp.]|nr:VWA domain-containing protein [Candidatus Elarobacter sp.]